MTTGALSPGVTNQQLVLYAIFHLFLTGERRDATAPRFILTVERYHMIQLKSTLYREANNFFALVITSALT
jgi:hypothetical protein